MSVPKIEMEGVSVVVRGEFAPSQFHPEWFGRYGLLSPEVIEAADVGIVHRDVASFDTETIGFRATRDSLEFESAQAPYEPTRDLAVGTLTLLGDLPVRLMGVNRNSHVAFESESHWHAYGHTFAPEAPWEGILEDVGLRGLEIQSPKNDGRGVIRVKIEPSNRVHPGVYIQVNDHYIFGEDEHGVPSSEASKILSEVWESSLERSVSIRTKMLEMTNDA